MRPLSIETCGNARSFRQGHWYDLALRERVAGVPLLESLDVRPGTVTVTGDDVIVRGFRARPGRGAMRSESTSAWPITPASIAASGDDRRDRVLRRQVP